VHILSGQVQPQVDQQISVALESNGLGCHWRLGVTVQMATIELGDIGQVQPDKYIERRG